MENRDDRRRQDGGSVSPRHSPQRSPAPSLVARGLARLEPPPLNQGEDSKQDQQQKGDPDDAPDDAIGVAAVMNGCARDHEEHHPRAMETDQSLTAKS